MTLSTLGSYLIKIPMDETLLPREMVICDAITKNEQVSRCAIVFNKKTNKKKNKHTKLLICSKLNTSSVTVLQNCRKQKKFFLLIGYISKSIFLSSDSFCLIISQNCNLKQLESVVPNVFE